MSEDKNLETLSPQELQKQNEKLQKRLERIIKQGDRQHKQFEKLNEQLASYIDVIDDHVIAVTVDKEKMITNVSTAFSNAFGFKSKELNGTELRSIIEQDDFSRVDVELHDSISSKQPWRGELRFINKAEKLIWTETIITPNFDEEELTGFTIISKDISKDKELKNIKTEQIAKKSYDQSMLAFMPSRSSALLQRASNSFSYILWIVFFTVIWAIVWANYAEIEELTRGTGKVIPSKQVKKVESFDHARVEQILVEEGDVVKKGQLLLRFNNIDDSSNFEQNRLRLRELQAKSKRLELESTFSETNSIAKVKEGSSHIMEQEIALYNADVKQLTSKISAMREKIKQKLSEHDEALQKKYHLEKNLSLLVKEVEIKKKMVKEKIISEVEYIQLQRQKNDLEQELNTIQSEISRAKSSIHELEQNIQEVIFEFQNTAKKEYHEVLSEIAKLSQIHNSLSDQLTRAEIVSPIDGTIKKMYVNTIGEVAQIGNILLEIVPLEDKMLVEVKIVPEDIAYLSLRQDAMMKFSAYDFSIYGGIKAKIVYISADTIMDEEDRKSYYIVHLEMSKNHLGDEMSPLPIKIGMVADVDIIHGKKSVMDYILKPILKAKQNALTEK